MVRKLSFMAAGVSLALAGCQANDETAASSGSVGGNVE